MCGRIVSMLSPAGKNGARLGDGSVECTIVIAPSTVRSTDPYRRTARRLRHVHAGDPVRLHRSLADLARSCDRRAATAGGHAPSINAGRSRDVHVAESFAGMVGDCMIGPVLPYSARASLLRDAVRMGIGRFEANLIIAAVQHRTDRPAETCDAIPAAPARTSPRTLYLIAALVQAMIIAGVRWIVL